MLKLRLQRVGRKNDPSFRVVVTESQNGPKSGNFLEILGSYDARQGVPQLKGDRIKHWLSKGALASDTVHNMLVRFGQLEGDKINMLPTRKPAEVVAEVAPAPEAPAPEVVAEATAETPVSEAPAEVVVEEATPEEAPVPEVTEEAKAE